MEKARSTYVQGHKLGRLLQFRQLFYAGKAFTSSGRGLVTGTLIAHGWSLTDMIFSLSIFCFYFYPTAWMCNLHCSLLISRLIFVFCQQNERSATDQISGRPPRCLDIYGPDNLDVSEHLATEEASRTADQQPWASLIPGKQECSTKCSRFINTLFLPQQNKPQTFLRFCKNKICTEESNLNEKPIDFGGPWCFPKVQEKHIWSPGSCSFCFTEE